MDGDDFDLEQFANELTSSGSEPEAAQQGEVHTFEEKYERFVDDMREHILGMGEARLAQIQEEGSQRFSTVLPANVVQNTTIALVGAGGLGNWIWRVLIGMGFRDIAIFDDDVVDTVNIGPQAHNLIDVGMFKVAAIRRQALAFRGVDLQVFPQRVNDLGHICSLLGYAPDIVISAVDNMEFRKRMIDEIVDLGDDARQVQLYIDLRMALGDWNCFVYTPKKMRQLQTSNVEGARSLVVAVENMYRRAAYFDDENGVQEPCTARAITYTGANVASYVGAFIHWWLTGGGSHEPVWYITEFYRDDRKDRNFNWMYVNSSREFLSETKTEAQQKSMANGIELDRYRLVFDNWMENRWDWGNSPILNRIPGYVSSSNREDNAYVALNIRGEECLVVRAIAPVIGGNPITHQLVINLDTEDADLVSSREGLNYTTTAEFDTKKYLNHLPLFTFAKNVTEFATMLLLGEPFLPGLGVSDESIYSIAYDHCITAYFLVGKIEVNPKFQGIIDSIHTRNSASNGNLVQVLYIKKDNGDICSYDGYVVSLKYVAGYFSDDKSNDSKAHHEYKASIKSFDAFKDATGNKFHRISEFRPMVFKQGMFELWDKICSIPDIGSGPVVTTGWRYDMHDLDVTFDHVSLKRLSLRQGHSSPEFKTFVSNTEELVSLTNMEDVSQLVPLVPVESEPAPEIVIATETVALSTLAQGARFAFDNRTYEVVSKDPARNTVWAKHDDSQTVFPGDFLVCPTNC